MKISRSKFSMIKQQYELTKMIAAYIAAEKKIITESTSGMADGLSLNREDIGHIIHVQPKDPETFHWEIDGFGNMRNVSESERYKELLLAQAVEIRAQLDLAIQEERFEDCGELEKVLNDIKKRYDSLD